jgi:hypothetical protein
LDYDEGLFLFIGHFYQDNLIEGITNNFVLYSDIPFNQPPIVSVMYAIIYSIFPIDFIYGRIFNVFLASFSIIILYLIVKNIWDYKAGLVASFIYAIDPTFVLGVLMNMDASVWFFLSLSILGLVKAIKKDTYVWHIIAGITFGLDMLTKWTLVIVPITYVFLYAYINLKDNYDYKNLEKLIIVGKKVGVATISAFIIFLPWILLMIVGNNFDILFMHLGRFTPLSSLNSIYQTWANSPFIFLFTVYSFIFYFKNNKDFRIPLIFGLIIIFPFYLLMPRYYDYSPMLIFSIILFAKPLSFLFEEVFEILTKLKSNKFNFGKLEFSSQSLMTFLLIFTMIGTNIGETIQESFFDNDRTVQETVDFFSKNIPENATVICTPEFGALLLPRTFVDQYAGSLGDNYYFIYSIINTKGSEAIRQGPNTGLAEYENITYIFTPIKRINDVTIYIINSN